MPKTRPKIEPTVLRYASMTDLPTLDELVRLAETNDWVIFEVPTHETVDADGKRHDPTIAERDRVAQALMPRLPFHTVQEGWNNLDEAFLYPARTKPLEAGEVVKAWGRFSTRRNMPQQSIEDNLDLFLLAAVRYEEVVNPLMERMAKHLNVDVSDFTNCAKWDNAWWTRGTQSGLLSIGANDPPGTQEWRWFFHGFDCQFNCEALWTTVEARMGFGPEGGTNFGVLDPGFFLRFINSAESDSNLPDVLRDSASDTHCILERMEQVGFLRRVKLAVIGAGWVLTDAGRQRAHEIRAECTATDAIKKR